MQEFVKDIYKTDQDKKRIISKLIEFKEAIILGVLNLILNQRKPRNIEYIMNV